MTVKQKGDLRILFWNIQDWSLRNGATAAAERFDRVLSVLRREKPDVTILAEVIDPEIKNRLAEALPGHTLFQTITRDSRELVAIFRHAADRSVTVEQRNEFSDDALNYRAFPLVRVLSRDFNLAVLGVHSKSGSTPESLARRLRTLAQIGNLQANLANKNVPLIALGDMNTMGEGAQGKIDGAQEIAMTARIMGKAGMTLLEHDKPHTWHGIERDAQYPDCRLDQALVSTTALSRLRPVSNDNSPTTAHVRVMGWPHESPGLARDQWIRKNSDHAYLVVDVKPQP
ncbi:MAG: endonuclease/exonuclease/phosphatase family protein [Alphaproteobacteria bacterium]|nr:endonuclease/exonuclease/phosphatase family protein [Alphaproteobacteria bacterium]MBU0858808.1 endonuclease/exonuclease/phosphatase family protein [Alphaproteobacteria bacterium]